MTTTKNNGTLDAAGIKAELEQCDENIAKIYDLIDEPDLTDAEHADAMRDLKAVVKRRNALNFLLSIATK